jgi:hypothetical protein
LSQCGYSFIRSTDICPRNCSATGGSRRTSATNRRCDFSRISCSTCSLANSLRISSMLEFAFMHFLEQLPDHGAAPCLSEGRCWQMEGEKWSGRRDLNSRPLAPQASALAGLRYAPTEIRTEAREDTTGEYSRINHEDCANKGDKCQHPGPKSMFKHQAPKRPKPASGLGFVAWASLEFGASVTLF